MAQVGFILLGVSLATAAGISAGVYYLIAHALLKGALFMAQLRVTLGDAAFWSGLRRYTRDHAGGTVTSIDLKRAMEEASGRDLRPLFAEWVFGEGLSEGQSQ